MDHASLLALLEALDNRWETEERRREERYMALIERVRLAITPNVPTGPVMTAPKAWAQKRTAKDDPEASLFAFEQLATKVVVQKLCDHMVHWLEYTQKTSLQMGKALVVEKFCHVVGAETEARIRRHNPDTMKDAVKLAEDLEDSLVSTKTGLLTAPVQRSS
ncbi:UNVERIFIED_CONTAM: hypothetical protein FKN15_069962 [Acipenser sinensis]